MEKPPTAWAQTDLIFVDRHDPVSHDHGLDLVMRDVHGGCTEIAMQLADFKSGNRVPGYFTTRSRVVAPNTERFQALK